MALPLVEERKDDSYWNRQSGENLSGGMYEGFEAAGILGVSGSLPASIADFYNLGEARRNTEALPKLSVEQLNERFNGYGVDFSGPETLPVAQMIVRDHQLRQKFQRRMELASQAGGFKQDAVNMFGGMLPLFPEMAVGGAVTEGVLAARGLLQGASVFQKLSRSFVSNATGMVPTEMAATARNQMYMQDSSIAHSAMNIAIGGAFGAAFDGIALGLKSKFAGRAYEKVIGKFKRSAPEGFGPEPPKTPPPAPGSPTHASSVENLKLLETAASQLSEGRIPSIIPLRQWLDRAESGIGPRPMNDASGRSADLFVPHGSNEIISGNFFNATAGRNESIHLTPPENGVYGTGQYGTNALFKENAKAVKAGGVIHQFSVNEARLFPITSQGPRAILSKIVDALRPLSAENDAVSALIKSFDSGEENAFLVRDLYEAAPNASGTIDGILSESGYTGIHWEDGHGVYPHNGVKIFTEHAPSVVYPGAALDGDGRFVSTPSPGEIEKYLADFHDDSNKLFHDNIVIEAADARLERALSMDYGDNAVVESVYRETLDAARMMADEGNLDPEAMALLEEFESIRDNAKIDKGTTQDVPIEKSPVIQEASAVAAPVVEQKQKPVEPNWAEPGRSGMIPAPFIKDMPEVPQVGDLSHQVKLGESILKSITKCLGGS